MTNSIRPGKTVRRGASRSGGFALVVTLSLMVLLALLAVGLLSLSSVSLRAATGGSAHAIARSNARLAVMLALGELQKSAGPDMRVTATADALTKDTGGRESPRQALTGVWRSWENSDLDASRQPIAPDYAAKRMAPHGGVSGGRFVSWLVSMPAAATRDPNEPPALVANPGAVRLLAAGTLGVSADPAAEVHLIPVPVANGREKGSYAWWIGGENSKANLGLSRRAPESEIECRDALASHAKPDEKAFFGTKFAYGSDPAGRLVSRETLDVAGKLSEPANTHFHNLTTVSRGLLTNTAAGGWRKDLSLLSEFGLAAAEGAPAPTALLYPFGKPSGNYGPVVRWPALVDFLTQYKRSSAASAGGIVDFPPASGGFGSGNSADFIDKAVRTPVVADLRVVLAYAAEADPRDASRYNAVISVNPVVTVWNPWNCRISVDSVYLSISGLPLLMKVTMSDAASVTKDIYFKDLIRAADDDKAKTKLKLSLKDAGGGRLLTLGPGETRVYSTPSRKRIDELSRKFDHIDLDLQPGYFTAGGFFCVVPDPAAPNGCLSGGRNAKFVIERMEVSEPNVIYGSSKLIGMYMEIYGKFNGTNRMFSQLRVQLGKETAAKYYEPITGFPTSPALIVAAVSNAAFASAIFHSRTANDTRFPGRLGFDTNPLANNYATEANPKGTGSKHPVNAPMELDFWEHSGWNDSLLPNSRGCIVTGVAANNGLNRCILAEIPLRPVRSLVELQNFQIRGPNPRPPCRTNILGNSTAYPLAKPNQVEIQGETPDPARMQWDDSYVMNRLFFDDWFVSSIAPETDRWSGAAKRPLEDVYDGHLSGAIPLPNAQYLPTRRASAEDLKAGTRHSTIASRLEVEGMFNVNSTSVEAWRSLLCHARDLEVPVLTAAGISPAGGKGHPVTRTTTPGDTSTNDLRLEQKFGGHLRLTDGQIEALATAIVRQIRLRGPALSLSEFVNRQLLGEGSEQSLAGPIQAALDELSRHNGADNPFRELQGLCRRITAEDIPEDAGYFCPKAADGWTGAGLPGWVTQADILRPLAPVLSARDDTFTIRACGTALADDGKTVLARVWCEAIVQRQADYIAPAPGMDPADDGNLGGSNKNINRLFGRRFNIVSIRYLSADEI